MPTKIPEDQYTLKPIEFKYLTDVGDVKISMGIPQLLDSTQPHITIQKKLTDVCDVSSNFDSINILTNPRFLNDTFTPNSTVTKYKTPLPEVLCDEDLDWNFKFNFWFTTPKSGMEDGIDNKVARTNIIPLKTNLTTSHHVTNKLNFRQYTSLDFGDDGLDKFQPELAFYSNIESETFKEKEFKFKIPNYSPPIPLSGTHGISGVPLFVDAGATAGKSPLDSDAIEWEVEGEKFSTWLRANENDAEWIYTEKDNALTSTLTPLVLLSGVDYVYKRPQEIEQGSIVEELIENTNIVLFKFDYVDGLDVKDGSTFENDGKIVLGFDPNQLF